MELKIISKENVETGKQKLPIQFQEEIRPDLIKRAVEVLRANSRQPYGADPMAGKKAATNLTRRRRKYKSTYGHGISRVPRKILSRNGANMNWVGAMAPGTVGGRIAHPAKAEKIWTKKINDKERKKAIRSAISATVIKELVEKRNHVVPNNYPFIVDAEIELLQKTKDVVKVLNKLGLEKELERSTERKVRAGKGKSRGRKYKTKKGPLIVVSGDCPLIKSARNILGLDVVKINQLNSELLAPGATPGRLTLFTNKAIELIEKGGLYL